MCDKRPEVTFENGRRFREQRASGGEASGGEVICLRFEEGRHFLRIEE